MKYLVYCLSIVVLGCSVERQLKPTSGTSSEKLLFTVDNDSIFADEFIYVYRKNNTSNDSAFTREDVANYLDLYKNFKLKVHEAREQGMDTTQAYLNEMKAYESQLKRPYLTETKVTQELIDEAYQRFNKEIDASHILILVDQNATPSDTLAAYNTINDIRKKAQSGEDFSELAKKYSQDPSAATNGGELEYFTSLQMVYPFENVAYTTPVDSISPIVRTQFGYHILKIHDKRPANGKVIVSHIMVRNTSPDSSLARNKIFEIYDQVAGGVDWNQLVMLYSEDVNSKKVGGRLQAFGIRQMPYQFQEAAFALDSGEVSDPIQTPYGWHIIRMEQRIPVPAKDKLTAYIEERIQNDVRADLGKRALLSRLRKEWNVVEYEDVKAKVLTSSDSMKVNTDPVLFKIGNSNFRSSDFDTYMTSKKIKSPTPDVYNEYLESSLLQYEENHLEEKYVDYRMLLREYREGILLFQLMEEEIWSKAGSDSTGLTSFYEANLSKYQWPKALNVTTYRFSRASTQDSIYALVKTSTSDEIKTLIGRYINEQVVFTKSVTGTRSELGINPLDSVSVGDYLITVDGLISVNELIEDYVPELSMIRGKVIADYQEYLEKQWIEQLKSAYNVRMNDKEEKHIYEVLVK